MSEQRGGSPSPACSLQQLLHERGFLLPALSLPGEVQSLPVPAGSGYSRSSRMAQSRGQERFPKPGGTRVLAALPPCSSPALALEVAALAPPESLRSAGPVPPKHFAPSLHRRDPARLLASGNKTQPGFNWHENYRRAANHRATPSASHHQRPPAPPQAGAGCEDSLVSDVIRGAPLACGHARIPQDPQQDRGAQHGRCLARGAWRSGPTAQQRFNTRGVGDSPSSCLLQPSRRAQTSHKKPLSSLATPGVSAV